jgi:hypothetical protein
MIALIVASTLISVAEAFYKIATPANANFEAHDAVIDGLHIALPPSMKTFPSELVPLP